MSIMTGADSDDKFYCHDDDFCDIITSNYPILSLYLCHDHYHGDDDLYMYIYVYAVCRYLKHSSIFPPTVTAKIHDDLLRSLGSQEEIRCGHGRPLSPWFRSFILHSSRACDPRALQRRPVESVESE